MLKVFAFLRGAAAVAVAAGGFGCSAAQLGLPSVSVSVASPDGLATAFVRNHPNIDPPSQSLWLERAGSTPVLLKQLGGDVDWCDAIAWSANSSTVAFLNQNAKLLVFDAATRRLTHERWLVPYRGEYPPLYVVRDLTLATNGGSVGFRFCDRRNDPKVPAAQASGKDLYDQTVTECTGPKEMALSVSGATSSGLR